MKNEQLINDDTLSQADDIILPSQYFPTMGTVGLCGEQRLMLAVLVDAINVLESWKGGGSSRKRRAFAEAAQWVNTPGTTYLFSFDSICDALDINSALLRSRLRVLTVRPANSARRPLIAHIRLKETTRSQRMTPHRLRRQRTSRIRKAPIRAGSESASANAIAPLAASASTGQAAAIMSISN